MERKRPLIFENQSLSETPVVHYLYSGNKNMINVLSYTWWQIYLKFLKV